MNVSRKFLHYLHKTELSRVEFKMSQRVKLRYWQPYSARSRKSM